MFFSDRDELQELNPTTRRALGGTYVQLPHGHTYYELSNPTVEQTIVLVHGFSVPNFIYDPTFEFLTASGFRVLRYDLFGRGYSDRPDVHYNIDLFVDQLLQLLDALRLRTPVNLIGLSMGGPITSALTLRHPERVAKLVLIDPAGVRPVPLSPLLGLLKLPLVAETLFRVVGTENLIHGVAKDFFDPALVEHFIPRYRTQMQYRGFKRAILSTVRHDMLGSFLETYRALGNTDKRILLLWGRHDTTTPFAHSAGLCAVLPQAEFHAIDQCGHIPHYERPAAVNPILLKFLR